MATLLCQLRTAAVTEAQCRAQKMGVLRNSFMAGSGSVAGFAAERGLTEVLKALKFDAEIADDFQYDVRVRSRNLTHSSDGDTNKRPFTKLELKTKTTTAQPLATYENSVSDFNAQQAADVYVFLRVQWDARDQLHRGGRLWFCGFLQCVEFKKRARFVKKGQLDGDNGYVCRSNCWSLPIDQCGSWSDFVQFLSKQ